MHEAVARALLEQVPLRGLGPSDGLRVRLPSRVRVNVRVKGEGDSDDGGEG